MDSLVLKLLQEQRDEIIKDLATVQKAISKLKKGKEVEYDVELISHWNIEGENDAGMITSNLEAALDQASALFMETNNRTDIHASLFVNARVGKAVINLPSTMFETVMKDGNCVGFKLKEA
jgi:hypothetical protein